MFDYRWIVTWMSIGLLVLIAACGGGESELRVQLLEQGNSGQSGIATLKAQGTKTEIVIKVNPGPPSNDPQPVHVHFGRCGAALGNIHYSLTDVVNGESTTLVDATLESLRDGNNAINLHLSYPEIRTYTACGDISRR